MDIYQLCRICVSHSDTSIMMSIFGEDALWKKIISFANVHIEEGDSLPQQICIQCAKNTINAFIFKQKCEEADSYFRKELLKKMELRLPDDTEIITIASGGGGGNDSNGDKNIPINMTKKHKEQQQEQQQLQHQQQSDQSGDDFDDDNFPTLIDANAGLVNGDDDDGDDDDDDDDDGNSEVCNGDNWNANGARHNQDNDDDEDERNRQSSLSIDEKMYDDSLPLIPEIELITPNDDDDDDDDNVIGNVNGDFSKRNNIFRRDINGQYQCNVCYKTFPMKSILKHHMKTCYQNTASSGTGGTGGGSKKNQIYECYVCKKSYLSKRFLEKHIRMSRCVKKRKNTTRPMQCSECRTLFPTGHHLGWHKRTGNCRSGSPKLSLTEYEQKNDSETNSEQENNKEFNDVINSGNQKRKKYGKLKQKGGRTRIKLDAKKIAYATELVKQQVSTTKFAQELKISRTFAWRLRKTLENNMYKESKCMTTTTTIPSAVTASTLTPIATPVVATSTTTIPALTPSKSINNATTSTLTKNMIPMNYDVKKQVSSSSYGGDLNVVNKMDSSMIGNNLLMQPHNIMTAMMAAIMMDAKNNLNNKMNLEQLSTNYLAFMNQKFPTQFPAQMLATAGMNLGGGLNIDAVGYQNDISMKLLNNNKANTSGVSGTTSTSGLLSESIATATATTTATSVPVLDEKFLKTTTMIPELKNEIIDNANQPLNYQKPRKCKQQQQQDKVIINENTNGGIPSGDTQINAQRNQVYGSKNESLSRNNKRRKPRKPNVAINEEKYLQAKILIANNVSTMEIAKILNISQMSAWKLRDCIMKNIPFPHHNRKQQQLQQLQQQQQQQTQLQHSQHQYYSGLISNNNLESPVTISTIPTSVLPTTTTPTVTGTTSTSSIKTKSKLKLMSRPKFKIPRQRLKRDERLKRDLIIKKEILSMIKEDNNIQYWKVSVRLAEKGYPISPSSVCQRLKSMGIHRRLKINEQQQQEQDNEQQQHDEEEEQSVDSNDDVDDDDGDDDDDDNNGDHVNNNGGSADALPLPTSSSQQRNIDLFKDHSHFLSTHFNNLG